MVDTAQRYLRIVQLYEKAAADEIGVPRQHRAAFARKASWFRLLATVKEMQRATVRAALRDHLTYGTRVSGK
jgi:hypothetical protein